MGTPHLLWTGRRNIDALVTVPSPRPLVGQDSVSPASPCTHAHARFPRDGADDGQQFVPQTDVPASPVRAVLPHSTFCPLKGGPSQQWDGQAASAARAAGLCRG